MKFSVATPVRNALPFLKRAIGSVRNQAPVPVEHIIQDACSTDGTAAWLAGQGGLAWRSEPDEGMYDALNRAWARARGDVLSYLNADEQYLPGTLQAVADFFAARPQVDAVFGDYIICDAATGAPLAARREIELERRCVVNGPLYAMTCTLFYRRRLLDAGDLRFDPAWKINGDADLLLRLLDKGVRIAHVPRYLALFGATGENMSTGDSAARENALIRERYGAAASRAGRNLHRAGRWWRKFVRGCYFPQTISYPFVIDEHGTTRAMHARRLGQRWRLE